MPKAHPPQDGEKAVPAGPPGDLRPDVPQPLPLGRRVLGGVVLAVVTPISWAFGVWDDHRPDKRGREGWR